MRRWRGARPVLGCRGGALLAAMVALAPARVVHGQGAPNPMDSISKLPSYRPAHDTIPLLTGERIARYASGQRAAWMAYIARSNAELAHDTAVMNRELRTAGVSHTTRAPYTHEFLVTPAMTPAWFATDSAQQLAANIVSFQAPNGGWSKHVDFTLHARRPGESYFAESEKWQWISTIDNYQTTEEIRFLENANRARANDHWARALTRGIDYLLDMQYPNGCYPQVYPLEGSYHDAATFNDAATVNTLTLLRDVANGAYPEASRRQRERAAAAVAAGITCILNSQVTVHDTLTVWAQQHDPLTLEPTSARSYELTALAGLESAQILDFLMATPNPSPRMVRAVYAGAAWFKRTPVYGYVYEHDQLSASSNAGPLWGRLYEIGTNRVIMSNRDGKTLYDWNQLTDRRAGYEWYSAYPAQTLSHFAAWSAAHPEQP